MITLSEYAFAKLCFFRINCTEQLINPNATTHAQTPSFLEVSLLGQSYDEDHLNYIVDLHCIPQECAYGATEPTDEGVLKFLEDKIIDEGIGPNLCGRFWAHTHPGKSPDPSSTDEDTFKKWFKDSDYGVMYILADGADSCRVKHKSLQLGQRSENCEVYVMFNKKTTGDKHFCLSTDTIFAMNKAANTDGYGSVLRLLTDDYSSHYPAWLEEIRKNVKKKYIPTQTTYTGRTHTPAKTKDHYRQSTTATNGGTNWGEFSIQTLINVLILNSKENINQFGVQGIKNLAIAYNVPPRVIHDTYRALKKREDSFDIVNLIDYEKELLTDDGKSRVPQLTPRELTKLCCSLMVRPSCLAEAVDTYIEKAYCP